MLDGQQEQQHLPFKIWIDLKRTTESITRVLPQTLCSSQERPRPPCSMPTISTSGSSGWWGMLGNIGIAGIRGMQQIQNCYRLWWIRRAWGFTDKCTHIFPTVDRIPSPRNTVATGSRSSQTYSAKGSTSRMTASFCLWARAPNEISTMANKENVQQ